MAAFLVRVAREADHEALIANTVALNRFENEISSQRRTRFRLSVSGSDLEGRMTSLTEQTYIPDTWLRGLRQEGAGECRF